MNTHIVYRACGKIHDYFAGEYKGLLDEEGFPIINFVWSKKQEDATIMNTADAWDLLGMCRLAWPKLTIEVQRVKELAEI